MRPASTVPADCPIPGDVLEITGLDPTPVWLNQMGGLTVRFEIDGQGGAESASGQRWRYLKRNPLPNSENLELEAMKLRWLDGRHPAPRVVDHFRRDVGGTDVEYLITEALPGTNAVDSSRVADANSAIIAIAQGLRMLHGVPVDDCPWTWSNEDRLGLISTEAAPQLGSAPAVDRLVVCHGDPCAPNTLIGDDGAFVANVDMQRLGVADRWADLAVATMSFEWNYSDFDEALFWNAYGTDPDVERIRYYRALWAAE
jgi:kanamycin kinase